MEYFATGKTIRLRSHHNKYLIANKDGETVSQSSRSHCRKAQWTVELVDNKPNVIRLRSFHGNYLTATDEPFLLGMTGKRVGLSTPVSDYDASIEWEPIREEFQVKLMTRKGKFLRANKGPPPYNKAVTIDIPNRKMTKDWVLWGVDIIDTQVEWLEKKSSRVGLLDSRSNNYSLSSSSSSMSGEEEEILHMVEEQEEVCSVSGSMSLQAPAAVAAATPRSISVLARDQSSMELFYNAKIVKLRSHHDKYLLADDDQVTVVQERRHGDSKRARWTVEYVKSVEGVGLVRLKSCYGKYLTATDEPFFMGVTGKKVHQTTPRRLDSSVEWEPIRDGMQVKLKTRYGNFLRANGGVPPWRNSITHDVPSRSHTQDWILWHIEVLQVYESRKPSHEKHKQEEKEKEEEFDEPFSFKCPTFSRTESSDSFSITSAKNEGRIIDYNLVDNQENVVDDGVEVHSIHFKGHTLEELKQSLAEETGLTDITVCACNPLNGKLYPLKLALPPNHVKMHVFLVPSTSEALEDLGTPSAP